MLDNPDTAAAWRYYLQTSSRVLLVEDDPLTRHIVRHTLKDHCCFATAPTAYLARMMIVAYSPDIILLDLDLPDQNGETILSFAKENLPHTQVILFTGSQNYATIEHLLENGAQQCIRKPFIPDHLRRTVIGPALGTSS